MKMHGWGRFPVLDCITKNAADQANLSALVKENPLIARGAGRSYGDSSMNPAMTVSMKRFNRMLEFDPETGELTVESGVILGDVVSAFLPRKWFPSVTPGTKFVTIGGMIAADVHGKNHHRYGSFGNHVQWIDLMVGDGTVLRCDREQNSPLFHATIGGMGLTGIILRACFKLIPIETAWIRKRTVVTENLDEVMDKFEASAHWTYSVAWIDCLARGASLGRSLIYLGEHAKLAELDQSRQRTPLEAPVARKFRMPFDAPSWALNHMSMQAFNGYYFWKGRRDVGEQLIDWDAYFYPLDSILDWNRIYGRRGIAEYQCVIPKKNSRAGIAELLDAVSAAGQGSFLAVLKLFGTQAGLFSFPMEGYTLALDFPASPTVLSLLEDLDHIMIKHGGRLYLAKDARISREAFEASDNRAEDFRKFRKALGLAGRFESAQSERLAL